MDLMRIEFAVDYLEETAQELSVAVNRSARKNGKRETSKCGTKGTKSNLFQPMRVNTLNFQFNVDKLPPANGKKFISNFF